MGSPAQMGAGPGEGRAPASAGLGHGRPTWPSSPAGGLGGRPRAVDSPFSACFLWFSGLFSKHRSRIDFILELLRSYLRYEHNGSCFVGFRGRLTLQTPRNVEGYRRNGLSGTQQGVPCSQLGLGHGMAEPLRLRGSAMADPHGRAPLLGGSGVGQAASVRPFEPVSLVFGAFLEAPKSYERDSRTVANLSLIRTQRFLFRRIQRSFDPPNTSKRRRMSRKRTVGDPGGGPLPSQGLGHGMAEPLRLRGSAMADPHGRAPLLGGSGVGEASSVRSFERVSLVFGAFLEAPKSYELDSRTVAKLSSIRTQRFLFRRIQRSFDPPNTSKRRRMSRKRTVGDPGGGPLPSQGLGHGMAEPLRLRGSAMADPHGRAPLLGGSGVGEASSVRSFERVSLVFGAFLEAPKSYRCDSQTVAKPSSIRTQRSLFRRIQRSFDPPNTSKRRRISPKHAVGDPKWGPLLITVLGNGMAEPLRLQGSAMADPHGRAPLLGGSGVGQAASVRSFASVSLVFGAFLEAPNSYERDS